MGEAGRIAHVARLHTLLTAADHRFARTLSQMLASAERERLHEAHDVVALDLGLRAADRDRLRQRFPWCEVRPFRFDGLPAHVRQLWTFAWKPIAIAEQAARSREYVLWFDSATVFRGPVETMLTRIAATGVFTLAGQTPLGGCCDPRVLARLGATDEDRRERYRAGGVLGFDPSRPVVREVLERWRGLALDPECIAPAGFDPAVHRFDQALLTAVLCAARRDRGLAIDAEDIDISATDPVGWISTRNKVPPWMPLAMDPAVRAWYALWKRADRAVLRVRAAARSRAGWYRPASPD
jgi:hypothetical protein